MTFPGAFFNGTWWLSTQGRFAGASREKRDLRLPSASFCAYLGCLVIAAQVLTGKRETMKASETAVVPIEFQNDFCEPDGKLYDVVKDELGWQGTIQQYVERELYPLLGGSMPAAEFVDTLD